MRNYSLTFVYDILYIKMQFFTPFLYKTYDYTITIEIIVQVRHYNKSIVIVINTKPQLMFDILNEL